MTEVLPKVNDLPCLPTEAPVETVTVTPEPVTISLPAPIGPISISTDSITVDPIGSHFLPKVDEPPQLPPNWVEERFRVDRRKLEEMILVGNGYQNGETFFQGVMDKTSTTVTWPSKLKIGAKSKKDPHVKVIGHVDNVKKAKEMILDKLDARSSRVTLKMDVPHTEHSHVIGKGGCTIKKVMEETGCHIHFPDSNRSGTSEKSNQVSIAGEPAGVESARRKIRALLPIVLFFELPKTGVARPNPDVNSAPIQRLIQTYSISVQARTRPRGQSTVISVRGNQQNVTGLKDGITGLMQHLTGQIGATLPVTCNLEVAPQHHQVLSKMVRHIQQQTAAQITMSQPQQQMASPESHFNAVGARRPPSPVVITGSVDSVIIARHQLTEYLPLVLMCDMKDTVDSENVRPQETMERNDVFISIRPKPKQATKSVIIKSVEGNVIRMFDARKELLGLKTSGLENIIISPLSPLRAPVTSQAHLPAAYHIDANPCFKANDSEVFTNCSGSSVGYYSSEEADQSLAQKPSSVISPIQRPSPRSSPGSSTSGHFSDSMLGSDVNNRKMSLSPSNSIEALEQRLSTLTGTGLSNKIWESKTPAVSSQFNRHQPTLHHSFSSAEYARARELAYQAMSRPVLAPDLQIPTSTWAGQGFSRSMGPDLSRALSSRNMSQAQFTPTIEENPIFNTWGPRVDTLSASLQANCLSTMKKERYSPNAAPFQPRSSSMVDISAQVELHEVFDYLGLSKYTTVFLQQEVDLQTFLSLTDADLKELGITTFGPRRKMLLAIQEMNKNRAQVVQGILANRQSRSSLNLLSATSRW